MTEIIPVNIKYDSKALYNYFKKLSTEMLEDTKVTYKNEIKGFKGNSIRELKQWLKIKGIPYSSPRKDIVAYPDKKFGCITNIIDQLEDMQIGVVSFFMQLAGEDVPLHGDYPYRKNCLLMLPIFYNEFQPTNAITYYKNGGEYNITTPVIMDVMKQHGVKNITANRLMLHIELPQKPINKLKEEGKNVEIISSTPKSFC